MFFLQFSPEYSTKVFSIYLHNGQLKVSMSSDQFLLHQQLPTTMKQESPFIYKHECLFRFSLLFQTYKKTIRDFKYTSAKETNHIIYFRGESVG